MEKEPNIEKLWQNRTDKIYKALKRPSAKKIIDEYELYKNKKYSSDMIIAHEINNGNTASQIIGLFSRAIKELRNNENDFSSIELSMSIHNSLDVTN